MLKKLIPLALFLSLTSAASAQISKGSLFLGGQISASKSESEEGLFSDPRKSHGFLVMPAVGTALKENLVLGVELLYGSHEIKYSNFHEQDTRWIGGGVFARRYVPLTKRFYFFGQAKAAYVNSESEQGQGLSRKETEMHEVQLSVYPGVSLALTKAFHLEAGFSDLVAFNYQKGKTTETAPSAPTVKSAHKGFGFSTNVSGSNIFLGMRFIIPR